MAGLYVGLHPIDTCSQFLSFSSNSPELSDLRPRWLKHALKLIVSLLKRLKPTTLLEKQSANPREVCQAHPRRPSPPPPLQSI
jgi:hypothetical protein